MIAVGIKLLKNKLSEYVRRASLGEVVLITDRENVVAELRAPASGRPKHVDDVALAGLVRTGLLRPALEGPGAPPVRYDVHIPLTDLLSELASDRGER